MNHDHTEPEYLETEVIEARIVPEKSPYWGPWVTIGFTLALFGVCLVVDILVTIGFVVPALFEDPKLDVNELVGQLESSGLLLSLITILRTACCMILVPLFIVARRRLSVREYLGLVPVGRRTMAAWLGVARIRTGSLWVPLAMHMLINLLATIETGVVIYGLEW
ncbi:MAG: hypothetical protein JXM70_24975 [Pirellulales bacterium]|nr:hypothetical protein [Pirellulales bacterium]